MKVLSFPFAFFLLLVSFLPQTVLGQERNILTNASNERLLTDQLLDPEDWVPFPAYENREAWREFAKGNESEYIGPAEEALDFDWCPPKATDYLDFVRTGSRAKASAYINARRTKLRNLVLAELMEGEGRFMDQIINGVWALCEQTTWVRPAHFYMQEAGFGLPDINDPTIGIFSSETTSLLAWTYYFFHEEFDKVDPLISQRLHQELYNKSLNVYYQRTDLWWMSFDKSMYSHVNNWNPWANSNILHAILLMEKDSLKRAWYVYKTMRSVDYFLNAYPEDGGCDEGPHYWGVAGGAMFEYLEILSLASGDKIKLFDQDFIKRIGNYICKVNVGHPYVLNFADASPRRGASGGMIYRYGKAISDEEMVAYGAFLAQLSERKVPGHGRGIYNTLVNNEIYPGILKAEAIEPLRADFYLPDLQWAGGRDQAGTKRGFYFGAKGGSNGESHNHNDVGSFMVFFNGEPVLIDVGAEAYTKNTFDPVERWKIWCMQSQYHNVPVINGTQQPPGEQYQAMEVYFSKSNREVRFETELSGAYPEEAQVKRWNREIVLKRGKSIRITEQFELAEQKGSTSVNFMTAIKPEKVSDHAVKLSANDFSLIMDGSSNTTVSIEEKLLDDGKIKGHWGERVYRILFTYNKDLLADQIEVVMKTAQ